MITPETEALTPEQIIKRDWLRKRFAKRPKPGEGRVMTREEFEKEFSEKIRKKFQRKINP